MPRMLNLKGDLLDYPKTGEPIYVDFPSEIHPDICKALNDLSILAPDCPREWRAGCRSSGHKPEVPRTTIIGLVPSTNALVTQGIIKGMIRYFEGIQGFQGIPIFIGRQSLFINPDSVIVEGISGKDMHLLQPVLGETLVVNPFKLVCIPSVGADVIKDVLSLHEELHSATVRFRKSSLMKGGFFARARALEDHTRADKKKAFALRQPGPEADRLQSQVILEILQLKHSNYPNLPGAIMTRMGELLGCTFHEKGPHETEFAKGDWQLLLRDGSWNGKILVQLASKAERAQAFRAANGAGVCLDGIKASIAVSSPTEGSLAAESLNASLDVAVNSGS